MFNYSDPTAKGVLAAQGALDNFREAMEAQYETATDSDNAFEKLETIPVGSPTEFIEWVGFPVTANASDSEIDSERFVFQDEYVEWHVDKDTNGSVLQVTFTTEFPEYYEALAEVSEAALVAGIQDAIPGANPTTKELFGNLDPSTVSPIERAAAFRKQTAPGQTVPANPWNNNQKGILCLGQTFNTLGALFNLARRCSKPNTAIPSNGQCAAVGGACGPNRNSDPRICERAQDVAKIPRALSLQDPAGVTILRLAGTWRINGASIDINDPSSNSGAWTISRNGRRATLRIVDGLTINNNPIVSGTQVSRLLDVGAEVISAAENDLNSEAMAPVTRSATNVRKIQLRTRGE